MGNQRKRNPKARIRAESPGSRSVTPKKSMGSWLAIGGGAAVALVVLLTVLLAGGDEDLPEGPPDGVVYHSISERDHTAGDADAVEHMKFRVFNQFRREIFVFKFTGGFCKFFGHNF